MYVCMQSKQALARAKLESCLFSNPKNKERPKPDMHWSILAQQQLTCTHVVSFYTREHILYTCAQQQTDMHWSILAQQQLTCTHVVSFYTREHILYICAHQQTDMHCSIFAYTSIYYAYTREHILYVHI